MIGKWLPTKKWAIKKFRAKVLQSPEEVFRSCSSDYLFCEFQKFPPKTSKLKGPSDVFIVNFEHISHLVLVFLLLTLNMQLSAGNLLIIYERRECSDSRLLSNNHTLSQPLKQIYFYEILQQLFLETPDCWARYFSEKYDCSSAYLPYYA